MSRMRSAAWLVAITLGGCAAPETFGTASPPERSGVVLLAAAPGSGQSGAAPIASTVSPTAPRPSAKPAREREVARRPRAHRWRSSWQPSRDAVNGTLHGDRIDMLGPRDDSPTWRGPDSLAYGRLTDEKGNHVGSLDTMPETSNARFALNMMWRVLLGAVSGSIDVYSIVIDPLIERIYHVKEHAALRAKLLEAERLDGEPEEDDVTPEQSLDAYDAYLRATRREPLSLPSDKPKAQDKLRD